MCGKNIKVWLLFCIIMEIVTYGIVEYYDCNILQFEIVKFIVYILGYLSINSLIKKVDVDEDVNFGINCGTSLALSSLLSAISVIIILKTEQNISWFIFLLIYIGTITLFLITWKKSDPSVEVTEKKKGVMPLGIFAGVGMLTAIGFGRVASDKGLKIVFTILAVSIIILSLFMALLFFVKYKNELIEIFNK